ncbi:hypothetical protein [Pseudoalteromonas denitrificans]|uniref:Uncharacterized protein n=1 Tax=Pseudoalteromonas denitrificans DSM 6059 TaxID=1123010 RepID=A0A1I1GV45_9GAMM|nr:hypothetical protein [Pseudoalteromonas denitrificans]SFC15411.1 hypothetical protein SAMN02745724_01041 [Pseudoalteromonas denitrificans DSM 6059]
MVYLGLFLCVVLNSLLGYFLYQYFKDHKQQIHSNEIKIDPVAQVNEEMLTLAVRALIANDIQNKGYQAVENRDILHELAQIGKIHAGDIDDIK